MLTYSEARRKVIEVVLARGPRTAAESLPLEKALGRVLAEPVFADRDYPPFDRSTRDGFAVRAADVASVPATLRVAGEIRAGQIFSRLVNRGECVQIMTGAAVPQGADAVVMIEHTRAADAGVLIARPAAAGQNIVPWGCEARRGQQLLSAGTRLGYAEMALAAQVGHTPVRVSRRPRVALLSTGDEVVGIEKAPGPVEIRNSNCLSLAAQVQLAGGEPVPLGNSPDLEPDLRAMMERGLEEDLLVLTGGVSMGKYDLVEGVLRGLGAEFFFDAVAIRPGRPAVFGYCKGKPVFGLPGNPVSTMVTFELFAVPAIDLSSGATPRPLPIFKAKLAAPLRQKAALTHFLPAEVSWASGEPLVSELPWQGSGDIVALARANAFLVVPAEKLDWAAGEWVDVMPRRGTL
jgi:molybdopterin molybdotransferase